MNTLVIYIMAAFQVVMFYFLIALFNEHKKIKKSLLDFLQAGRRLQAADNAQAFMLRTQSKKITQLTNAIETLQESGLEHQPHAKLIAQIKKGYNHSMQDGDKQLSQSEAELIKSLHL